MYIKKIEQTKENECFQYGLCEYLANALHEEYGYPAMALIRVFNERDDISNNEIVNMSWEEYTDFFDRIFDEDDFQEATVEMWHAFSYVEKDTKTYYIDSTGITNSLEDILNNFGCKPKDGQSIKEYLEEMDCKLLTFQNPQDMQKYFWSTKYDEDSFVHSERQKYAQDFVKEHTKDLNVNLQLLAERTRTSFKNPHCKSDKNEKDHSERLRNNSHKIER